MHCCTAAAKHRGGAQGKTAAHNVLALLHIFHHKAAPPCHFREAHSKAACDAQQYVHILAHHATCLHSAKRGSGAPQAPGRITFSFLRLAWTALFGAACLTTAARVCIAAVATALAVLFTKVVILGAWTVVAAALLWITVAGDVL